MFYSSKKHLKETNKSYFKHMFFALEISIKLILAGITAFVHSLIPGFFKKNASTIIINLSEKIKRRKESQDL